MKHSWITHLLIFAVAALLLFFVLSFFSRKEKPFQDAFCADDSLEQIN